VNSAPEISRDELTLRRAGPNPPLVIDVLPVEEYNAAHLPKAKHACVFSVNFLDDIENLAPDRSTPLVLYGSSFRDFASATAAEKLVAAGYTQVSDYRGGLEDWRAAGQPVEENLITGKRGVTPSDGVHQINVARSRIDWTGRNLGSAHHGTIKLLVGQLEVRDGRPVQGSFTLDMDSIENLDIQDPMMRQILIRHLKSDDFFDVPRYPVAEFQLSKIRALSDAHPGNPNYEVAGELTLKAVSGELLFPAILAATPDGLLAADAHFDLDRTRWNVLYGSGKFYEKLGKHVVNDQISLALKLLTLPRTP
jgi:rhodanese-related sulfurtransferase/polyisoprenoid-binding protein YceI